MGGIAVPVPPRLEAPARDVVNVDEPPDPPSAPEPPSYVTVVEPTASLSVFAVGDGGVIVDGYGGGYPCGQPDVYTVTTGVPIQLNAVPGFEVGLVFDAWLNSNDVVLSTANPYSITVLVPTTIKARFIVL